MTVPNIDSLQIEMQSNATPAEKSLDALSAALGRLKRASQNTTGLEQISSQLRKLSGAAASLASSGLNKLPAELTNVTTALKGLRGATAGLGGIEAASKKLDGFSAAVNKLDAGKIGKFANSTQDLSIALTDLKEALGGKFKLNELSSQVTALSNASAGVGQFASRATDLAIVLADLSAASKGEFKFGGMATQIQNLANALPQLNVATLGQSITQLMSLSSALGTLKMATEGGLKMTPVINQLRKLAESAKMLNNVNVGAFASQIQQITAAFQPLSSIAKGGFTSIVNSLQKLPALAASLSGMNMGKFAAQIKQVSNALGPLASKMSKISAGFASFPRRLQQMSGGFASVAAQMQHATGRLGRFKAATQQIIPSNAKLGKSFGGIFSGASGAALRLGVLFSVLKRGVSRIASWTDESSKYVENLNLFTVAMGKYSKQAQAYAETVHDALGIDTSEWMRNQGIFKQMASGFGVAGEKAYTMSKGLTQLGYDYSSFYNAPVEEAMQKLQSAIAGEIEPVRRWGIALDQATLKQVALRHGITTNISAMTQGQKAQLRYVAIMEQSKNAMGDMARTIITPANAMRILQQQFTQLSRALGNIFIPILSVVIPYVQAFTTVLINLANTLAAFLGFKVPEIDYSGLSGAASAGADVEDSLDGARGSAEKLKRSIAGFDELNVIESTGAGGGGGGAGGGGYGGDLPLDISDYDFLQGLNGTVNELVEKMMAGLQSLAQAAQPTIDAIKRLWVAMEPFRDFAWQAAVDFWELFLKPIGEWTLGEGLPRFFDITSAIFREIDWGRLQKSLQDLWNALLPFSQNFFTGLLDFYEYCLKPLTVWTIGVGLPELLDIITAFADSIDWGTILQSMRDLWAVVAKFAQNIGQGLINFIDLALRPIATWVMNDGLPSLVRTITKLSDNVNWDKIHESLNKLWNSLGKFGINVGQGLVDFIDKALIPISGWTMTDALPSLADTFSSFLDDIDWTTLHKSLSDVWDVVSKFAINIGDGLLWFLETVLKPLGDWAMNSLVPATLESIQNALGLLNTAIDALKPLGTWLWENWLKPLGEWTGGKIVEIIEKINEVLTKFSDWISTHQEAFQTIVGIVLSFAAAWALVQLAISAVQTVLAVVEGIKTVFALATNPVTLLTLGIGLLIMAVVLIIQNWDWLKEKTIECWEAIKTSVGNFFAWWKKTITDWWNTNVAPWFTAERWIELGEQIKTNLSNAVAAFVAWWNETIGAWWRDNVLVWFTKKKWTDFGNSIKDNLSKAIDEFIAWWKKTIAKWWDDNVATWFTKEKWAGIASGIWDGISEVWSSFTTNWGTAISGWWDEHVAKWFTLDQWKTVASGIWEGISEAWSSFTTNWSSAISGWWDEHVASWFKVETWKALAKGAVNGFIGIFNGFITDFNSKGSFFFKGLSIPIPDWLGGGEWNTGSKTVTLWNIPSIPYLATGGIVNSGQMFIANERGPELIGSFGNKTGVMNNAQIVDAVSQGVYEAVVAGLSDAGSASSTDGGAGQMIVQLIVDGVKFGEAVINGVNSEQRRTGRQYFVVNPV